MLNDKLLQLIISENEKLKKENTILKQKIAEIKITIQKIFYNNNLT